MELYGGTIQGVYVDNDSVEITDVVFLENTKYSDTPEYTVNGGQFDGQFIYNHNGEPTVLPTEDFAPVLAAAQNRIDEVPIVAE